MTQDQPIAHGSTADVYVGEKGRVLKLFHAGILREYVEHEARIGRIVVEAGISAPQVYEIVERDGRWGIVYERIVGDELGKRIRPWNARQYGREMARLHVTLFTQRVPDLPSQRERLTKYVKTAPHLTDGERQRLLDSLNTLPDGDVLCHGDFHPSNIILTARGLTIIDWNDAKQGHPAADITRTLLILGEAGALSDLLLTQMIGNRNLPRWVKRIITWGLAWTVGELMHGYRGEIVRLVPEVRTLIPRWMPVLAAARLHEGQYVNAPSSPEETEVQRRMVDYVLNVARADDTCEYR